MVHRKRAVRIENMREFGIRDEQSHWTVVVSTHNIVLKKKKKTFFSQKKSIQILRIEPYPRMVIVIVVPTSI